MPRCLRLHKIPTRVRYCAICGSRVIPGWAWTGLSALLLALLYGAITRLPSFASPVPVAIATQAVAAPATARPTKSFTQTSTSTPRPTLTPTRTSTPSLTPTPTATLYPRAALLTYHGRFMVAKGEGYEWILRQETNKNDPCAWFTVETQDNGRVSFKTCNDRYITAPASGFERADWLLRQEPELSECGKFTVIYLEDKKIALQSCTGHYVTAGDGGWEGNLQWTLVAETTALLDWEKFRLVGQQ